MLQTCGGGRVQQPQALNKVYVPNPPEMDNHRCVRVHHKDPYTKLGPFKIEYVHHNPFFLIIHDLLTEEDMDYLKTWATPRLSRKRDVQRDVEEDQESRGKWVEQENGDFVKHVRRTIKKSVQAWLDETTWDPVTGALARVDHPRALDIARRIERAVSMNLTAQHAAQPMQVGGDLITIDLLTIGPCH